MFETEVSKQPQSMSHRIDDLVGGRSWYFQPVESLRIPGRHVNERDFSIQISYDVIVHSNSCSRRTFL